MSDKMIETSQPIQDTLIEEHPSTRKDLWLQLKKSPNRWVWLGLGVVVVSLLMSLPYIFFGSYLSLYLLSGLLVVAVVLFLGFPSLSNYSNSSKLNKFLFFFASVLTLWSFYHLFNYDRHVLVDYHERLDGFPYELVTKDIANPQIDTTESFTISVNSTQDLKFGPDFESLATEVHKGSKDYKMSSLQEFKPFTIYFGSDSKGKTGDIKGKRTVYGWFGSTSTNFVIELER
jgi:hypothetical protein